jgi:hypothetical protein
MTGRALVRWLEGLANGEPGAIAFLLVVLGMLAIPLIFWVVDLRSKARERKEKEARARKAAARRRPAPRPRDEV